MSVPHLKIFYGDGEWSALYVDGELERVGDTYWVEELAFELAGVETVQDSNFMRGQHERSGVAPTLTAIIEYATLQEENEARAATLRAQAEELMTEATRITTQA